MSDNHWETQPRKKNGEFTFRFGHEILQHAIEKTQAKLKDDEIRKTTRGGSYGYLRKFTAGNKNYEIHHMPANSISPLSYWKGPCIIMYKEDHARTSSYGNSKEAKEYRKRQRMFIEKGQFLKAQMMDINEIRKIFGAKYNNAINEKLSYEERLESEGIIYENA